MAELHQHSLQDLIEIMFKNDNGARYATAGGQPYSEARYVNIPFLLVLATWVIPLACGEWQW
jgi:hypothetical protein